MSTTVSSTEIERIASPSRQELDEYLELNQPVIITGVVEGWPAFNWDADHLAEVAGDETVRVNFEETGNFFSWYERHPSKRVFRRIPLREFLDLLRAEPPDLRHYMTEHSLHLLQADLMPDLRFDRYVDNPNAFLFLGRDTSMPLHYHSTKEALLAQLSGSKQVTLVSPDQFRRLYAKPWYAPGFVFSRVDGNAPDLARFPAFAEVERMEFTLEAGEMLFIPVHWWHLTRCAGFQLNVTTFWPSRLRRFTYPSPGLQVHAHDALGLINRAVGFAKAVPSKLLGRS